ncbi:MAG: hypothetical protein LAO19_14500 [Acidobacteriia bacterium]|nr:hypothetical protein [Terriglobia bacterium]
MPGIAGPAPRIAAVEEGRAVKRLSLIALLVAAIGTASCHGTPTASTAVACTTTDATTSSSSSSSSCTDPVTGITVTISPVTISVNVVASTQFFGSASGGTNSILVWKVNDVIGGNDTVGRIDSSGLYRAPSAAPSPSTVKVSATAFEDMNVSATSTVTITPPPVVTIAPTSWTMAAGTANTKAFTPTVTGAATTNVDWYVGAPGTNPILGGNALLGTVDANGVYTSPRTPPLGSAVTVTAVSRDFPLSSASAAVTISGYSTSSLQGQFAFSVSGRNASGPFFRAGSFTANGSGGLTSGLEDINEASGVTPGLSFTGAYAVTADGRGSLQFADGHSPATFDFVLVNGNQLQITGFDNTGAASGQAFARDVTAFSNAALSGTYVFDFAGVQGANGLSQVGEFTADGSGNVTRGLMDSSAGGVANPQIAITGGTYSVNSNTGRGTATLVTSGATFDLNFYVVSRGSAEFVGTDASQQVAGATSQQTPNATFSAASLLGNFAFLLSNAASGGTFASAGSFSADGNGNLTSGVLDENSSGALTANLAFNGTYSVTANGRGVATFTGGRTYVFYLASIGNAIFQQTDLAHPTNDGLLAREQAAAFSQAQIAGNYALATSGLAGSSAEVVTGELAADGAGVVSSGTIDLNAGGTLSPAVAVTGAYAASSSAQRGTLALTLPSPLNQTRNYAVYVLTSPQTLPAQQILLIRIDAALPASGMLFRRF